MKRLKTRCKPIDRILGGGIEYGIITMVYGESGTGKTNFCLQASRECAKKGIKVVYIDSEGVSFERLSQISSDKYEKIVEKMLFFRPNSFESQEKLIEDIKKVKDPGLIIIDTINLYYRMELEDEKEKVLRSFLRQMGNLQMIAREKNIPVIVVGQVYTDKTGEIRPFIHRETDHLIKTTIRFDKKDVGTRTVNLIKHRSEPEGKKATFKITGDGLE